MDQKKELYEVYENLVEIKGRCSYNLINELNIPELTFRQIEYIKKIGQYEYITISKLANLLELSKPSITQMIKKFIKLECVYKKQCNEDGRVQYIYLTDKGKDISEFEDLQTEKLILKIIECLNKEEIGFLIDILRKIK